MKCSCMKNISEIHPPPIRQFDIVCEKINLRVAPKVHIFRPVFIFVTPSIFLVSTDLWLIVGAFQWGRDLLLIA